MKNIISAIVPFIALVTSVSRAELVITMGGDINFNKTEFYSHAEGFSPGNKKDPEDSIPWKYFTEKLETMLDGDLNFANIETVVTNNNAIEEQEKRFKFRTHPFAIEHLLNIGFNFFSIANNHAYDFKEKGMVETLKNLKELNQRFPFYYHGVGKRSELLKPKVFTVKGYKIAFAAISFVEFGYKATEEKIGLLDIRSQEDYWELVKSFKDTSADLKILSIHNGIEGKVTLDTNQKKYYEYAIDNGDVDLIIGHHPHAARPVSLYKNKLIFYSLGNYMMLGSANITRKVGGADWGLFAKVVYTPKKRLSVDSVEMQLLTNTHTQVKPLLGEVAKDRFKQFAELNDNELGDDALPWVMNKQFKAVYCPESIVESASVKICRTP